MRWLLTILICATLSSLPAEARERIALVVGNGAYGSLGALPNPVADAQLIAGSLRQAGFEVKVVLDSSQTAMKRAIVDFGRRLRNASPETVGLFYFAGHGIQSRGKNFLLPVGTDLRDEAELDIVAVEANWVLRQMESAGNATNIVILDACRNNPFAQRTRSVSRGLARMDAPTGSFVAYATAPGDVALDGVGRNSPYTAALAKNILQPDVPIEQLFKRVRVDVLSQTQGQQVPWDSSSLTGDFYFVEGATSFAQAPAVVDDAEIMLWTRARDSRDPETLRAFLDIYPNSIHAAEARAILGAASAFTTPIQPPPTSDSTLSRSEGVGELAFNSQPIAQGGKRIALRIQTDWSKAKPTCGSPGDLGIVRLTVGRGTDPVLIHSSGSDTGLSYNVRADPRSGGVLVSLTPIIPGHNTRPIKVFVDSTSPGSSGVKYSSTKIPNRSQCGSVTAYVNVVE